ncbi:MAG: helix-turn-helix transcriptional regulator [Firmicutes bacterium]|nr:helix-turn-helix transcriptional regulator [Bacillota bacterium]MBR0481876.1 helix-turn-helix transcriptional regulator [Bacillota bacterium]
MVKNLRYLREKNGVSQKQLAKILGVSQQSVNKYENQTTDPDIPRLIQMANHFNTSVDFLVGNTDIERKYEEVHENDLNDNELMVMSEYRETDRTGQEIILSLLRKLNQK